MKKITLLITLLVIVAFCTKAQPTLTYEGNTPQIGDIYYQSYSQDFVNPGPQGPNKTWNFSTLTVFETGEIYAISPSATPFADIFTDANIAFNYDGTGTYNFSKINQADAFNLGTGFDDTPPMVIYYNNSAQLMQYPFNFTDEFSDSYSGEYEMEGMHVAQSGTLTKTADAWGVITTPAGTYENVLRLKTIREEIDSFWMDDFFLWRTITQFKDYEWFTSSSKVPVFAITISSSALVSDTVSYFTTGMTGLSQHPTTEIGLSAFPNPATDLININFSPGNLSDVTISIVDLTGHCISSKKINGNNLNNQQLTFNLTSISPGIYFVRLTSASASLTKKIIRR